MYDSNFGTNILCHDCILYGENKNFEAFKEKNFVLVVVSGELLAIQSEALEKGPVPHGDEKEHWNSTCHFQWRLSKCQRILKILRETRILWQGDELGLVPIERVGLAYELAPLFEPFWFHVRSSHQQEALAEKSHRMTETLTKRGVVLVIPCQQLVLSFLFG